jgi:hypothetical protein
MGSMITTSQMIIMTPSEHGRDGLGIGVQFLLELTHGGICWFSHDDGEVQMGEG